MKHQGGNFARSYLIADLVLSSAVLVGVAWNCWEAQRWMSFAGFGSLFVLMLLTPLLLAQQAAVFLLAMALKRRRRWMVVTASILQVLCLLPPLALIWAIGDYYSWYSLCLEAQLALSAGGLIVQHWVR